MTEEEVTSENKPANTIGGLGGLFEKHNQSNPKQRFLKAPEDKEAAKKPKPDPDGPQKPKSKWAVTKSEKDKYLNQDDEDTEETEEGDHESPEEENKKTYHNWKSETEKLQLEREKLQRDLKETQRWATETKKQISSYKKAIEKYKEEGILSDEEATELMDHTKYQEMVERERPLLEKASEVWDREIENIRKYGDDTDLDKHIHAFQHFLHNASSDEIKDVYREMEDLIDSNPVAFTKKMLQFGKQYHDEIFGEFAQAGNLKNFKRQYEEKIDSYKKKIDKLEKEVVKLKNQYEGYDEKPNYRIPQGGDNNSGSESNTTKRPGKLIERFNQGQYHLGYDG